VCSRWRARGGRGTTPRCSTTRWAAAEILLIQILARDVQYIIGARNLNKLSNSFIGANYQISLDCWQLIIVTDQKQENFVVTLLLTPYYKFLYIFVGEGGCLLLGRFRGNPDTSTAPLLMWYTSMGYTPMRYTSTPLYFYTKHTQLPSQFFN
jgi:hypothetical protein